MNTTRRIEAFDQTKEARGDFATADDYTAAIQIAAQYGEVVEPGDFVDGTIDGMDPLDWAHANVRWPMTNIVWQEDDCLDPQHRVAYVRVGDRTWMLHAAMTPPEAWGFQAYHHPYDGHSVHVKSVDDIPKE